MFGSWSSSVTFGQQVSNSVTTPEINFTVSMPQPHTHLLVVEMRVRPNNSKTDLDLAMPVWTPGSYLIREYARHVQDFTARDATGQQLTWEKINKNTWRVARGKAAEVVVNYRVYANELTVRTNELNDRHAFWTPAALLLNVVGALDAPATVRVEPYGNWKVATGLPAVPGQTNTFRAENFDVLYDAPFDVSDFTELNFEVRGVPHRIVIDGTGNYNPNRLRDDTQKIVLATANMMGELPYKDYTFLLHLRPTGGGGLEHLNSTALIARRDAFTNPPEYLDFLTLVAHEYFHLWNVKRIKPDALGPFDYDRENYTKLLWVAEGITSYYENVLVLRAGLMRERQFLDLLTNTIKNIQSKPGRQQMSLEEASFDAWVKYYRQDENSINSQISYYDKGALVGWLLDLEIRRRSDGSKSLDDVMRYLYREYALKNRNYTPTDFQRAVETVAGQSLEDFFRRYVRGRDELDYNAALNAFGLRLNAENPNGMLRPYLGADIANENGKLIVRRVYAGSPAYEQGLNTGDEILAMDGFRVTPDSFNRKLAEKSYNATIALNLFRLDELRTFTVKLTGRVDPDYRIIPMSEAGPAQRRLYQGWLGATLD